MDEPGQGGASHHYELRVQQGPERGIMAQTIRFQDGAISKPEDVNGITNEALLAVLIDRLRGFQGLLEMKTGKQGFPSRENAIALTKLEEALLWLQKRTRDRLAREYHEPFDRIFWEWPVGKCLALWHLYLYHAQVTCTPALDTEEILRSLAN